MCCRCTASDDVRPIGVGPTGSPRQELTQPPDHVLAPNAALELVMQAVCNRGALSGDGGES